MSNRHFDLIAGIYEKAAQFTEINTLLAALDLPGRGILLDAGGGTGRVSALLREFTNLTIVADISPGMLQHAKKKELHCVYAPAEFLPFLSGSIDRIIMIDAFHHVNKQHVTAQELLRVLKPGGRIVLVEPDIRDFGVKLIALGEKLLLMRSKFFEGKKIQDLFNQMGANSRLEYSSHKIWAIITK